MVRLLIVFLFACTFFVGKVDGQEPDQPEDQPPAAASKIESVTLYRDQALITRVLSLKPGKGVRTVLVADLPELLVADSFYAEGDDNASIRAVRMSNRQQVMSSREQQQVSVTLVDPGQPVSEDGLYSRIQRSLGILRWDLEVPENRNGSDAFDVDYKYTIEFDRSRQLSPVEMQQQMQEDYFQMQLPSGMGGGMGGGGTGDQ